MLPPGEYKRAIPLFAELLLLLLLNVTVDELEDFHGLPLSMRNGHSIDGASPGSDLNEGTDAPTSALTLTLEQRYYNSKKMCGKPISELRSVTCHMG